MENSNNNCMSMNERHDIKWDVNEFLKILVLYNGPVSVQGKDNVQSERPFS